MSYKTVLVTGANGYIGNAIAKTFSRAGWKTFGLTEAARMLPIWPWMRFTQSSGLPLTGDAVFDVVVSNTEDRRDPGIHFEKV